MTTNLDGVAVACSLPDATDAELRAYVDCERAALPSGTTLTRIIVGPGQDPGTVLLQSFCFNPDNPPPTFQRIRRITGYLVGNVDCWNNAKRAELNDRVKHCFSQKR